MNEKWQYILFFVLDHYMTLKFPNLYDVGLYTKTMSFALFFRIIYVVLLEPRIYLSILSFHIFPLIICLWIDKVT